MSPRRALQVHLQMLVFCRASLPRSFELTYVCTSAN
jgi:hypothetical protein